jgi:hypothetical protein
MAVLLRLEDARGGAAVRSQSCDAGLTGDACQVSPTEVLRGTPVGKKIGTRE